MFFLDRKRAGEKNRNKQLSSSNHYRKENEENPLKRVVRGEEKKKI